MSIENNVKTQDNSSKNITKKRDISPLEITEKSKELSVAETYLDGAKIVEKSDGSSEIELHLNNFWGSFGDDKEEERLAEEVEQAENDIKNGTDRFGEKTDPLILKQTLEDYKFALKEWEQFKEENKNLVEKLINFSKEKSILLDDMYNQKDTNEMIKAREKVMQHYEESNKFYEEAYLILARKGVSRKILRG